jgi:hypothetical protein
MSFFLLTTAPHEREIEEGDMKRHEAAVLAAILAGVTLFGMTLVAHGQEKAEQKGTKEAAGFTISRTVVGTGVENNEPVGAAETFPGTTEKVYCFLEAADIAKDTEVSLVWFHGQDEKLKSTLPLKEGKRWRTYADKNLRGLKGDWKVEIKDADGNLLKEVKFKVE